MIQIVVLFPLNALNNDVSYCMICICVVCREAEADVNTELLKWVNEVK